MPKFNWLSDGEPEVEIKPNLMTGINLITSGIAYGYPTEQVGIRLHDKSVTFIVKGLTFTYPTSRIELAGIDTTVCCEIRYEIHEGLRKSNGN